jgi:PAS domain S-box-containing protein
MSAEDEAGVSSATGKEIGKHLLGGPQLSPPASTDKASLLIVDDRESNLLALETVLINLGQKIVRASSGRQALSEILEQDFAVILMDVRMPGMDGFETAELIRRRKRSSHIPIIFVTAADDAITHQLKAYSLGAVDYILKPIDPDVLRSKVRVFIELHQKSKALEDRTQELAQRNAELAEKNQELRVEVRCRRRAEESLKESRDFYLGLFNEFPALIWKSNAEGKFDYFNRSWLSFVGRSLDEQIGEGWTRNVHAEDLESCLRSYRDAFDAREPFSAEFRLRRADGEYRWVASYGRPHFNLDSRFAGYIGSCYDLTERRRGEEKTREANRELEAFSYTVSHDLRSPLRSIAGLCQILIEDFAGKVLDEGGLKYARSAIKCAELGDELIRDLLSFSRLAREQVELGPVDLDVLVGEVAQDLCREPNPVTLNGTLGKVTGNRVFLAQVFSNLFSNAVKFVVPGRAPEVRVRRESRPEGPVRIWVEDNGIGIAPEYHERIFRVFERLEDARAYPGTGIGLAIVRRAMDRLGGNAGVESEPGKGARFWIELGEPRVGSALSGGKTC